VQSCECGGKKTSEPKISAEQAKAAFTAKFTDTKQPSATSKNSRLNSKLPTPPSAKSSTPRWRLKSPCQSLVNAMVEAGEAAYRRGAEYGSRGNEFAVYGCQVLHDWRQIGPGVPSRRNPEDVYYPIDGGEQYERALPIIKLLIDGGAPEKNCTSMAFSVRT